MYILKNVAGILSGVNLGFPNVAAGDVISGALNLFYFITGSVAVVVIIVAGYYFVLSGGNPSTIAKAKSTILNAVIGLIIVIIAFAITNFITGSFK